MEFDKVVLAVMAEKVSPKIEDFKGKFCCDELDPSELTFSPLGTICRCPHCATMWEGKFEEGGLSSIEMFRLEDGEDLNV